MGSNEDTYPEKDLVKSLSGRVKLKRCSFQLVVVVGAKQSRRIKNTHSLPNYAKNLVVN
jgi:hypothetical protein